jgi:transcription antitermination factor NusG
MKVIKKWFVVYTRPRWEKKISAQLSLIGVENYCPVNKVTHQWSDRKKVIDEPLFKGYLFVRIPDDTKWQLLQTPGIINYVYWLGKPAIVRDKEIENIRKFLNEFPAAKIERVPRVDESVEIKYGVFMNYKGVVLEVIGRKVKIKIQSLNIQLTAVFDAENVEII